MLDGDAMDTGRRVANSAALPLVLLLLTDIVRMGALQCAVEDSGE
jgi:hypothetical protein